MDNWVFNVILFVPCPLIIDILSSLGMLEPCDAVNYMWHQEYIQ